MGGPIVMRTAAAVPDRVGAGASFHGGGLVTKNPDSPHLLVPTMKAQFLFAVAENDDEREPEVEERAARRRSPRRTCRRRSRCMPAPRTAGARRTRAVYNEKQAEQRHGARMLALFGKALA